MAVPEESGPDAERQEVKRDEQEFRTAQQQVKKTTLGRARRERSVIINEYESDETSRTKQFSQLQTWRNHSLKQQGRRWMRRCKHPKKVDQRWNDNFQEDEAYH